MKRAESKPKLKKDQTKKQHIHSLKTHLKTYLIYANAIRLISTKIWHNKRYLYKDIKHTRSGHFIIFRAATDTTHKVIVEREILNYINNSHNDNNGNQEELPITTKQSQTKAIAYHTTPYSQSHGRSRIVCHRKQKPLVLNCQWTKPIFEPSQ